MNYLLFRPFLEGVMHLEQFFVGFYVPYYWQVVRVGKKIDREVGFLQPFEEGVDIEGPEGRIFLISS